MSAKHTKQAWQWLRQVNRDPDLPSSATKVALSVADHWNERTGYAFPGTDLIASEIGMTQSTALAGGNALEQCGHLRIERGSKGSGHSHHYYPLMKYRPADISKSRGKYRSADISTRSRNAVTDDDEIPL